jgi:DNA-binding transcriptional ArsR family regulator
MSGKKKPATPDEVLLAILRHPLRKRLLRLFVEAGEELRSPRELSASTEKPISNVSYHVRVLAERGAVALIDKQPCRGSIEHFYTATSLVDEVPWGRLALGLPPASGDDPPNQPSASKEDSA